jgi:uncharacterized protein YbjT (DUF2867 family)
MSVTTLNVLVVGATGSIGRLVVDEAIRQGHKVRVLVRDLRRAGKLPAVAQRVIGDLTLPDTLVAAVDGIDAIVFTHGADGGGRSAAEHVSYGGVRNVFEALRGRPVRVALMTAIGVTNRTGSYNRSTEVHDWKRRSERLLRASGLPYTIVRPGWFDYNAADQHRLVLLQGDTRHAGVTSDGIVARAQIAQVLVRSLTSASATRKTFELAAERGPATKDFDVLFAALDADTSGELDAVRDAPNMPLPQEPDRVREDLRRLAAREPHELTKDVLMSIAHRAFFPLCVLMLAATLVMPRVVDAAEKAYTNSIGMEFVPIPAGTFLMGSSESDREAAASERPQHRVTE